MRVPLLLRSLRKLGICRDELMEFQVLGCKRTGALGGRSFSAGFASTLLYGEMRWNEM
jgi:hypothetical protein